MEIIKPQDVMALSEVLKNNISKVIIGEDSTIKMMLAAIFAGGHVLLEDVPGSGKTMLAKSLAKSIDGCFKRVQMTPDLLPADITGINFYNMKTCEFQFMRGPVFTNILIADEINRATPKTQAGLLEAMEERQVTVDGNTYELDKPFMVIATENPLDTQGVFPLPEAQIDRFAVKLHMGYPDHDSMCNIIKTHMSQSAIDTIAAVAEKSDVEKACSVVKSISISNDLIDYVVRLVEKTRDDMRIVLGISQRGALALVNVSKSLAAMSGRGYVLPDDIKEAAPYVLAHRLILKNSERVKKNAEVNVIESILNQVPVPTEDME